MVTVFLRYLTTPLVHCISLSLLSEQDLDFVGDSLLNYKLFRLSTPSLCGFSWFCYHLNMICEWKPWRGPMQHYCWPSTVVHCLKDRFHTPLSSVFRRLSPGLSLSRSLLPIWAYWCLLLTSHLLRTLAGFGTDGFRLLLVRTGIPFLLIPQCLSRSTLSMSSLNLTNLESKLSV